MLGMIVGIIATLYKLSTTIAKVKDDKILPKLLL